jgi:hypothetical protein
MNKKSFMMMLALLFVPSIVSATTWFSCDGSTACGSKYANYSGGKFSIGHQSDSPTGNPNVWKWTYYVGPAGPGTATLWPAMSGMGSPSEMWGEFWYKFSPGFEYNGIVNKIVYFNPSNTMAACIQNGGSVPAGPQLTPQGPNITNYYSNKGSGDFAVFPTGVWHKYKSYWKMNSHGNYDGVWRVWIDDVLVAEHTKVYYAHNNETISSVSFAVIWGGMSGYIEKEQYLYIADIYFGSTDPGPGGKKLPSPPSNIKIE